MNICDKLIQKINDLQNPTTAGLDTSFDYLPPKMQAVCKTLDDAASAILDFNLEIIEKLYTIVPSVKVQVAYYEMYGVKGIETFQKTLVAAKAKGLITIADVKRNDIGSTAACYSKAYLGKTKVGDNEFSAFDADYITVNGYLGGDGITPFLDDCKKYDKGIFVLVKTSNPSSGQLQNKSFVGGGTLYENMGALVDEWGRDLQGESGFSSVGAVVGATHPSEAETLRKKFPNTFFLIPGYGAQGGTADSLSVCFNHKGEGGIVNNSRGILCAYKTDKYKGLDFAAAARAAAEDMQADLYLALKKAGKIK